MDRFFAFNSFLHYTLLSTHAGGHGIHSPFIYNFIKTLLEDDREFYAFKDIENRRKQLQTDNRTIQVADYGVGSSYKPQQRKIRSIAKSALIEPRTGKLLFKIIDQFQFKTVLELGTSLGISAAYLSLANNATEIISIEGCPAIHSIAQETKQQLALNNLKLICAQFDSQLPVVLESTPNLDLVYFDGNHGYIPTISYFEACVKKINTNSIFIFDDIYWSREMKQAWKYIQAHKRVILTLDLHRFGLVFFRDGMKKQNYVIRY